MQKTNITLDFSYAKTPLFVRQTTAVAFGIPIDREFTWEFLRDRICDPANLSVPCEIQIVGFAHLSLAVPDEAQMLMDVLRGLRAVGTDIEIWIVIND